MTPEIRAARDRLGAVLDRWEHDPLAELFGMGTGPAASAFKSDLRTVLAALDENPRPCSHTWDGRIDTSETGTTIHLSGYSGSGKLLAAHARARDLAADLTEALDVEQAEAEARAEGWIK